MSGVLTFHRLFLKLPYYSITGDAPSVGHGGRRAGWPEQPGAEREQEGARAAGQAGKEAAQEEQGSKFGRMTFYSTRYFEVMIFKFVSKYC